MYITVRNALELQSFTSFKLLAGEAGLYRKISKIVLLDHEIVKPIENQFFQHEFALSSLLGAKDDDQLILGAIKYLIDSGVSGLAFKNVYYKNLPEFVLEYANIKKFPIFVFDNTVFFEDIITEFRDMIRDLEYAKTSDQRIDNYTLGQTADNDISILFYDLAGSLEEHYCVVYIRNWGETLLDTTIPLLEKLSREKRNSIRGFFKYHEGVLVIIKCVDKYAFKEASITDLISQVNKSFYVGLSDSSNSSKDFIKLVRQAMMTSIVAYLEEKRILSFKETGIYKLIIPYCNTGQFASYVSEFIDPIIEYDKKHNSELHLTLKYYFQYRGNCDEVANQLYQHKNTIRYRISRIKKILGLNVKDSCLFETVSIAIKTYQVNKLIEEQSSKLQEIFKSKIQDSI